MAETNKTGLPRQDWQQIIHVYSLHWWEKVGGTVVLLLLNHKADDVRWDGGAGLQQLRPAALYCLK